MPAPSAMPQTSQLAIWSLVLSLLGFFCLFCFGFIPGIITGHMALSRIKASGGTLTGEGLAVAGLIIGYIGAFLSVIACIAILAGMLLPALAHTRNQSRRATDMNNLKQIGLAVAMYESDHTNQPPSDFQSLFPYVGGTNNLRIFKSPSSDTIIGAPQDVDVWSDYELVPGPTGDDPANEVRAFTKSRHDDGGNVLFRDGHVQWLSEDEFDEVTRQESDESDDPDQSDESDKSDESD
jgi:prepilin-type processing-associated H-X9-DG protein